MRVTVRKWGNSLAVRLPRTLASDCGLSDGSLAELRLAGGKVILAPMARPQHNLEKLLAGVTKGNLHGEVDAGGPAGREAW